jgi:general secretion pathway protein C
LSAVKTSFKTLLYKLNTRFHHNRLMKTANAHTGSNSWTLRLFTLAIWLLVGLCAAYWVFKFVTTKPVTAAAAIAKPAIEIDSKAVAKLLGATDSIATKAAVAVSNVKLTLFGLATARNGQGVALIATEDKPAKPYRVGAKVTDDLVLKTISKGDAILATSIDAPDGQTLSLPSRKPATYIASSTTAPGGIPSLTPPPGFGPPAAPPVVSPAVLPSARPTGQFDRGQASATTGVTTGNTGVTTPAAAAPTSRFAARAALAAGTSGAVGASGVAGSPPPPPAFIAPAPGIASSISPDGSTIIPAAAASSAPLPSLKSISPAPDGISR